MRMTIEPRSSGETGIADGTTDLISVERRWVVFFWATFLVGSWLDGVGTLSGWPHWQVILVPAEFGGAEQATPQFGQAKRSTFGPLFEWWSDFTKCIVYEDRSSGIRSHTFQSRYCLLSVSPQSPQCFHFKVTYFLYVGCPAWAQHPDTVIH